MLQFDTLLLESRDTFERIANFSHFSQRIPLRCEKYSSLNFYFKSLNVKKTVSMLGNVLRATIVHLPATHS